MRAIVFVLRGCSAGWLGAYGNEWIGTPNLDRLAAEGIVFDRHISNCPDLPAACRAWLKGESTPGHSSAGKGLLPSLRKAGTRTILVRANHPDNDAPDWYYADWDELFDVRPQEEDRYALDSLIQSLPALLDRLATIPSYLLWIDIDSLLPPWNVRQEVFEAYIEDVEEDSPEGSASQEEEVEEIGDEEEEGDVNDEPDEELMVEVDEEVMEEEVEAEPEIDEANREPVTPWADPPTGPFDLADTDAREWLHCTLAAVVTGLDAELGVVFEQLRSRGLDQTATWLLTADFGYPLGEHGQIGRHRPWLHEELVHIPLMIRLPGAKEACRRAWMFTQPQDVFPTLMVLAELPPDASEGISLVPALHGEATSTRDHAITKLELGEARELSIRTDEWSFLLPVKVPEGEKREPQLFTKPDDRWEVNDLHTHNIERCDEFEAELRKYK